MQFDIGTQVEVKLNDKIQKGHVSNWQGTDDGLLFYVTVEDGSTHLFNEDEMEKLPSTGYVNLPIDNGQDFFAEY